MQVSPSSFLSLGKDIMKMRRRRAEKTVMRLFRAHFGASPEACSEVWDLLCDDRVSVWKPIDAKARPEHLLWALLILKTYDTEELLCSKLGVDEKTFRKWSWRFIVAIAALKKHLVNHTLLQSSLRR